MTDTEAPGGRGAGDTAGDTAGVTVPGAGRSRPRDPLPQWYRRRPTAELQLDCSGGRHTVRWHRGRLVLLDHDLAAEVAMVALGADRPACVTLFERWRALFGRPTGRPGPSLTLPTKAMAGTQLSLAGLSDDLRSFGPGLSRVAESALLVRAERRWADPDLPARDRQRLVDAFGVDLKAAFAASLRPSAQRRGRQTLKLDAQPLPSGEQIEAEATFGPNRITLVLRLPLAWVVEVAGRGLAQIDGRLVLAVADVDDRHDLVGVSGIVWQVDGPGRVGAGLQRWWMRKGPDGWVIAEGHRPVRPGPPIWWTSTR